MSNDHEQRGIFVEEMLAFLARLTTRRWLLAAVAVAAVIGCGYMMMWRERVDVDIAEWSVSEVLG